MLRDFRRFWTACIEVLEQVHLKKQFCGWACAFSGTKFIYQGYFNKMPTYFIYFIADIKHNNNYFKLLLHPYSNTTLNTN